MFCPKCGKSDQVADSYCRQCGTFLPDLSKPVKQPHPPEQHITANIVLSSMTIVTSFVMAILLWSILGFRSGTHPLIYVTAGLLFAMGCWHIQTLWRTILLKGQLKARKPARDADPVPGPVTDKQLRAADFEGFAPASVTDRTTTLLKESRK